MPPIQIQGAQECCGRAAESKFRDHEIEGALNHQSSRNHTADLIGRCRLTSVATQMLSMLQRLYETGTVSAVAITIHAQEVNLNEGPMFQLHKFEHAKRLPYLERVERMAVQLFEVCVIQELDEVVLLFLVAEARQYGRVKVSHARVFPKASPLV